MAIDNSDSYHIQCMTERERQTSNMQTFTVGMALLKHGCFGDTTVSGITREIANIIKESNACQALY